FLVILFTSFSGSLVSRIPGAVQILLSHAAWVTRYFVHRTVHKMLWISWTQQSTAGIQPHPQRIERFLVTTMTFDCVWIQLLECCIYTAKEKGDENMIRIEILFDRQSTKNLKSGTLQALQNEIEQRLKPH
ncbi:hypothetical protein, partial [Escherichia coli]